MTGVTIFKLESDRLFLFPLSKLQLANLITRPDSLSQELGFALAKNMLDVNVQRAIKKKLDTASSLDEREWLWKTYWLIKVKHQDLGAGLIGFKGKPDAEGFVEIGYGIDESVWNKGYMTEALQLMLDWAFEQSECKCVTATTVINPASERVLQKNHFTNIAKSEKSSNWYRRKPQSSLEIPSKNIKFDPIDANRIEWLGEDIHRLENTKDDGRFIDKKE